MRISRRAVLRAAGGAVAMGAAAGHAADDGDLKALYEAAKKEGQLSWYSGILDQPLCVKVGDAFTKKYPGISVNAIKTTSQVAFQRLMQDLSAGAPQSDVFTTTDVGHIGYLIGKGLLVKYVPPDQAGMVPSLHEFTMDGYAQVSWLGLVTIIYNSRKVTAEESPKDWPDLTNPKWKDKIAFGSPNYSGLVGVWMVAMENRYGWDYFEKLNKLNPLIGRSIDDANAVLNSGERIVAAGNPSSAMRNAARGNPLVVNYPTSGTLASPSPSTIIKGSRSPNAAKLFMNFLAGREYSAILSEAFEQPLRADVPPPKGAKSIAELQIFAPTIEQITKQLPPGKEHWRDTFGG
jgi:iron(III) transport system substrate-binding protein